MLDSYFLFNLKYLNNLISNILKKNTFNNYILFIYSKNDETNKT